MNREAIRTSANSRCIECSLVPAADTQFAKDATFGYRNSNLKDWAVEKSKGSILIVNAAATEDIDVVVLGLLNAATEGRKFLFRTGAAFVSSRLGIPHIPPITAEELSLSPTVGGLIIAGSYVPKTTSQLETLQQRSGTDLTTIVLDVPKLLQSKQSDADEISHAIAQAEKEISRGQDVLLMTSRDLVTGDDEARSLDIGTVVANALVAFLSGLTVRPRYIIAKVRSIRGWERLNADVEQGGITSSDAAKRSLGMKRALVVGQASSGVPLWRCDEETSKFRGLPFVVWPGVSLQSFRSIASHC